MAILFPTYSSGFTYLSRAAAPVAAPQVSASRSLTGTDIIIYDPRSTNVIVYSDHCVKHGHSVPLRRPRFSPPLDRETNYGKWEAIIEEEPWSFDIPFLVDANNVKQSPYIDPEDSTYTFATGTPEEPATTSTSSSDAKKEPTGHTDKSRKGSKVQKTPKSWLDKLLRTTYKLRSRFAQRPRNTRERVTFTLGLVLYPTNHFIRNRVLGFIHRHIKVFAVYAVLLYLGVRVVCMAVEHRRINMHPAFALFEAVLQDFLRDLPTRLVPRLSGLAVEFIDGMERRRPVLRQ
ncbi:hypothetical protein BS17DRAFT_812443 [Gyrodon lividus]|nr:hypothetical protein BS17DRAFT_812443 [Gyrodon lividus]